MAFQELHSSWDLLAIIISAFLWEANAISFNNMNKLNCINWFRWSIYSYNRISCNKCILCIIFIIIIIIIIIRLTLIWVGGMTVEQRLVGVNVWDANWYSLNKEQDSFSNCQAVQMQRQEEALKTSEFGLNFMMWKEAGPVMVLNTVFALVCLASSSNIDDNGIRHRNSWGK